MVNLTFSRSLLSCAACCTLTLFNYPLLITLNCYVSMLSVLYINLLLCTIEIS